MSITSRFDEAAAQWDSNPTRVALGRAVGEAICGAVPWQSSWRVLDYGAGTGLVTLKLQPYVGSILAMDSSPGMLATLKTKLATSQITTVETCQWDLEARTFPQTEFDLVVSSMTFHHLRDVPLVLGRLTGLLKSGGWLAFADLEPEDGSFHGEMDGVFHHGFAGPEVERWLRDVGLTKIAVNHAHTVEKLDANGCVRSYGVFLAVGQKSR
jgi:ubiquinone/menaquinone biosynthesis C-methylase UbiE